MYMKEGMFVIKRDGRHEPVLFDKITSRIKKLVYGLHEQCEPILVAQKVANGIYKGVTTSELDELAAETAASMTSKHPDYSILAARISVSNLHKSTKKSFSETAVVLSKLLADDVSEIISKNADRLDSAIVYDRDFDYDYLGNKTLERSYL